jgi:hypothetical protein
MSLEEIETRKPSLEIAKKIGIGVMLAIIIFTVYVVFTMITTSQEIQLEEVGTVIFLIGGIYLVIGSVRDLFGSIIVQKIRKKDVNKRFQSKESEYFYGFGKAGEDVVAGIGLVLLSFLTSIIIP